MKTISIFQVQDINNLLKQKNYDYTLKLHDACGSQSLFLQCHGNNCDINELCPSLEVLTMKVWKFIR